MRVEKLKTRLAYREKNQNFVLMAYPCPSVLESKNKTL